MRADASHDEFERTDDDGVHVSHMSHVVLHQHTFHRIEPHTVVVECANDVLVLNDSRAFDAVAIGAVVVGVASCCESTVADESASRLATVLPATSADDHVYDKIAIDECKLPLSIRRTQCCLCACCRW